MLLSQPLSLLNGHQSQALSQLALLSHSHQASSAPPQHQPHGHIPHHQLKSTTVLTIYHQPFYHQQSTHTFHQLGCHQHSFQVNHQQLLLDIALLSSQAQSFHQQSQSNTHHYHQLHHQFTHQSSHQHSHYHQPGLLFQRLLPKLVKSQQSPPQPHHHQVWFHTVLITSQLLPH